VTTARDVIDLALRDAGVLGVGQTASAEDINGGLRRLNMMLGQWNAQRYLVFRLMDVWCQSTGAINYQVGPGGDIDMPMRPSRIEGAFFRQGGPTPKEFSLDNSIADGSDVLAPAATGANTIDWPLTLMESREEYNSIALKGLGMFPTSAYYDPQMPFGRLYVWSVPPSIYELHILVRAPLQTFANLSDNFLLPPEYEEAIHYNLVVRLQEAYGLQPTPFAINRAREGMMTIRSANAQIPLAKMPSALWSRRGGGAGYVGAFSFGGGGGTPVTPVTPTSSNALGQFVLGTSTLG
jgi:hypothetical protein